MNNEDELRECIPLLSREQRWCMATMSAESLIPVVRAFGTPITAEFFAKGIEILWQEIRHSSEPEVVRQVFEGTMTLPESNEDDSNKPSYYAMCALGILYSACEVSIVEDSDRAALDACFEALGLCSSFDSNLEGNPIRFFIASSYKLRQKGRLEALQAAYQHKLLEVIQGTAQTEESKIEQSRIMANNFAGELERILPDISRIRGWVCG